MSIFTKIADWVKYLFDRIDDELEERITLAITAGGKLKQWLNSPTADLILFLIPGDTDDKIRAALDSAITQAIAALQISQECADNPQCWAEKIAALPEDLRDAVVFKFASKVLSFLDAKALMQRRYDTLIQNSVDLKK